MRRTLVLVLALLVGGFALLFAYVAWDYDPDTEPPLIQAPSYQSIFEEAVLREARKPYAQLDETARRKTLAALASKGSAPVAREVALVRLRDLRDRDAALAIIRKELERLSDAQFEAAVATLAELKTGKSIQFLDSLHRRLSADPAAHTPLGDYRMSAFRIRRNEPDLTFDFRERSRGEADYTTSTVREISLLYPADPTWLVVLPNVDDVLEDFRDSRFVATLDTSPVRGDVWTLPVMKTLGALRERMDAGMGMLAPFFSPERFFKDYVIAGKYGEEYLFATLRDKNVAVADNLMSVFERLGRDFGISRRTVDAVEIAAVSNRRSGRILGYASVGDYFVVATDTALLARSIHTFTVDRGSSAAIDPLLADEMARVDPSGRTDVLFAWMSPTTLLEPVGSESSAARRLSVVARALGRAEVQNSETLRGAARLQSLFPTPIASALLGGEGAQMFWRYVVDVRSLGRNRIDSLARIARVDIGKEIIPWIGPGATVSYYGIDHLDRHYGFANTGFDILWGLPLEPGAPATFDSTFARLMSGITSLVYDRQAYGATRLWLARDTVATDTLLLQRKLQPSFAVVDGNLLVASTPELLRRTVTSLGTTPQDARASYLRCAVNVDSFATNSWRYLTTYLGGRDTYTPDEIHSRLDPLRRALALYATAEMGIESRDGLRRGTGALVAKR